MGAGLALPAVYAALVATLEADPTLLALLAAQPVGAQPGIFTVVPQNAKRPYVRVGDGTEVPLNTMGVDGTAKWGGSGSIVVTAVTAAPSDAQGLAIVSRVKQLLQGPVTVAGYPRAEVTFDSLQPTIVEEKAGVPYPVRSLPMVVQFLAHGAV